MDILRIVIACAGKQSRWNNYLNVSKHLVPVTNGEPLLDYTIRNLRQVFGNRVEIVITIPYKKAEYYRRNDIHLFATPNEFLDESGEMSSFPPIVTTRYCWNPYGPTLVVLGDVFFTPNDFKRLNTNTSTFFGKDVTNQEKPEHFGWMIHSTVYSNWSQILNNLIESGTTFGSQDFYNIVKCAFITMNDTCDFDVPDDYNKLHLTHRIRSIPKQHPQNDLDVKNFIKSKELSETDLTALYKLIQIIHDLCDNLQLPYWAVSGTLLGAIRHGSIMKWDDDADLGMYQESIDKLINHKQLLEDYKINLIKMPNADFYKVFFMDSLRIADYPWSFPFIDIFSFIDFDQSSKFTYTRGSNSGVVIEKAEIDKRSLSRFGQNMIYIPANSERYLDLKYIGWQSHVVFQNYNHRLEKGIPAPNAMDLNKLSSILIQSDPK